MIVEPEKNIYGLSEGVYKACLFLGLKFPSEVPAEFQTSQGRVPSDYFGDNFKFDTAMANKLQAELHISNKRFATLYKQFAEKYLSQKCFRITMTDLNVYFCDYLLFATRQNEAIVKDYFSFEFYKKSFEARRKFLLEKHTILRRSICNDPFDAMLLDNKAQTNKFFADFLHRDWLDTYNCTFEDFKIFVEKHPRFFSKPLIGAQGSGAQIISIPPDMNLKQVFEILKKGTRLLEEIVIQHKSLQEFCPDTVNTVRVNTFLDIHNVVHILTASGRFGRIGGVIDNFHGGGMAVIVDPKTGIITSDGLNFVHERIQRHPDTGKIFKGFQYPFWNKVRAAVVIMSKMIPKLRHVGWDLTINNKNEVILIEANGGSGVNIQQAPYDTGRLYLYQPLIEELQNYKNLQMQILGYKVNNFSHFDYFYNTPLRSESFLQLAMDKLIPDSTSLIDLGCRKEKFVKSLCPDGLKYYPVDFKQYDDEVIARDFNAGEFPDIAADACLCALTAEYVELLPQFLANLCNVTRKQVLMMCCPVDKERNLDYRWNYPFLTDFNEEFLIKTMQQNNFQLNAQYAYSNNQSVILYDFRRV